MRNKIQESEDGNDNVSFIVNILGEGALDLEPKFGAEFTKSFPLELLRL